MNAVVKEVASGFFTDGLPNDEYHKPEKGLSTSDIKRMDDPASIIWNRTAEQDTSKLSAVDFGTDFHLYFLESDSFHEKCQVLPVFNRRKPAEKQEELDMIADWKSKGIIPVTNEDFNKCKAMRESALAHPTIAAIMALGGIAERSYFWTDPKTGVECKCRPDLLVLDINDSNRPSFMPAHCTTLVFDVKTIAQIGRIQNQIEELQYFVQDAFYTRGIEQVTGSKVFFCFGFVSTSLSLGRYPVKVVALSDTAKFDGRRLIDEKLAEYSALSAGDKSSWQTIVEMDRPYWATKDEDLL
ncbi:PD-(D/E)XK nuclease-like domain-containing protein [uncultured Paraglaciecola sp.]|uniref:PD-(D/E)XK nuclease-like domain-containing protein n=1 Tax=uncultured Paraglaciecola sp. TaxID=1765024 RepID=UPI00261B17E4|nr:PD-(D/E)XK nuclease-like domain-containing protein [uncultured Paraglaciecola sp.]